jgi:hypothetical protein
MVIFKHFGCRVINVLVECIERIEFKGISNLMISIHFVMTFIILCECLDEISNLMISIHFVMTFIILCECLDEISNLMISILFVMTFIIMCECLDEFYEVHIK